MDDAPTPYEQDTRVVACVALGEAMAGRIVAFSTVVFLVEAGIWPREAAVEMVDTVILKLEEKRPTVPAASADQAIKLLAELMERIAHPPRPRSAIVG
jgi:hypothetical protein